MSSVVPHYLLLTLALPALLQSVDLETSKYSKRRLVEILACWLGNPGIAVPKEEKNEFVINALKNHTHSKDQVWALQQILRIGVPNFRPNESTN